MFDIVICDFEYSLNIKWNAFAHRRKIYWEILRYLLLTFLFRLLFEGISAISVLPERNHKMNIYSFFSFICLYLVFVDCFLCCCHLRWPSCTDSRLSESNNAINWVLILIQLNKKYFFCVLIFSFTFGWVRGRGTRENEAI